MSDFNSDTPEPNTVAKSVQQEQTASASHRTSSSNGTNQKSQTKPLDASSFKKPVDKKIKRFFITSI